MPIEQATYFVRFVDFSMNRVRMLIHFGVIPYMVFDGDYLPSKASTEGERAKKRDESRKLGLELHRLGKPSQAHLELQKAVDVTPEMARQLIEELKKLGVQYVVAPYEADAQLAYLERKGVIQGIISEDSDLLVFGAKCLLTKLDQYGDCVEVNRNDFTACREISLVGWTDAEFRRMAILSGCDYLTNINKMGLKTAYRYVRKYKSIEKIIRMLQFDGHYHVPAGYLEAFKKAELTFLYQRVFCPLLNEIVMTTSMGIHDEPEEFAFIGSAIDPDTALGVAKGDLHPMTKEPIVVKSTSGSLPKTPWGKKLKESLSTPANSKVNKPINTFFKAKRTPLAELDPNSFTPSPSQQRLLQQANGSWRPTPAPTPPTASHSSTSMPASAVSSAGSSHTSLVGTSLSVPYPQKRRRLCVEPGGEGLLPQTSAKGDMHRSRFFPPSGSDPSPSLKRHGKDRGRGKEINIWSDDSIEDVMAELPDVSEHPVLGKTRKLQIFEEEESESTRDPPLTSCHENSSVCEDSQSSITSRETFTSNATTTTMSTTVTNPAPSTNATSDNQATSEFTALSERFTYEPVSENRPSERNGDVHKIKATEYQELRRQDSSKRASAPRIPHSASSVSGISHDRGTAESVAPDQDSSRQPLPKARAPQRNAAEHKVRLDEHQSLLESKTRPPLLRQRSMTPLQRLGAGALHRSQSCIASLNSSTSISKTAGLSTEKVKKDVLLEPVTVSKFPRVADSGSTAAKGSEDAMIPDSEEEAEDRISGSELEEPAGMPKLNLGRFAFSGQLPRNTMHG